MDAFAEPNRSPMICHAMRLTRGMDIRDEIQNYVTRHGLNSAFIITCVGSVKKVVLRFANSNDYRILSQDQCKVNFCFHLEKKFHNLYTFIF